MIKKIISSILISATLFSNVHAINWGLSYTNGLNQPPNGEDTVQNLAQYNTYFMGDTSKKTIYLTFDAGYENGYTATILDVLKKQNVPVAFFLLEHYIDENPELVKRMANEGHIVGNHTSSHPNITKISNTKLINEVNNLKTNQNLTIEIEKNKIKEDLNKQISDLTLSKEQLKVDLNKEKEEEINALKKEISLKQERINQLELNKSSLNVKRLGEELEKWCQNEYESYSNAGAFLNSSFIKDNDVIKEEDESKGSKGDFIFKHYSSSDFKDENLLTSICLEMKNESNVSTHKKTNASYFTQLDKNRNKKKLEYALLVSELEWDSANDVPIKKVNEYEKMFIVRPPYFISFISLLVALSDKYKDILVEVSKTKEEFKKSDDVIKEFDEFKRKYLEDIMTKLNKKISKIGEDAKKINDLSISIMNDSNDIINGFINEMKLKIDRFDISKIARKLDRLED